jgi:very-short-patch-repair endonuclease
MRRQRHKREDGGGGRGTARCREDLERGIARVAGRQHGVVTRAQLVALGFEPRAIDRRVEGGRLHRLHRGVYLAGHVAAGPRTSEIAATLSCGPDSVLSHRSATAFWELLPYPARPGIVDVTVIGRDPGSKPGIRIHRVRRLPRSDYVIRDAIPVTTPARTIFDLAGDATDGDLERALAEAQVRKLVSERGIADQLERNPGRPGARALRALIEVEGGPAPTRAESERRVLRLVRASGLPVPEVNVLLGPYEVDFLWRGQRLALEMDGFASHGSRSRFERDRLRDSHLAALGYTVVRITWRQLAATPEAVVARLAAALARRS